MKRLRRAVRLLLERVAPQVLVRRLLHRIKSGPLSLTMRYEPELRFLPCLVARGAVVIDVGANAGNYGVVLQDLVGPEGRVICFEPQLSFQHRLRRLLPRATVVGAALSNRQGDAVLRVPRIGGHATPGRATIEPRVVEEGETGRDEFDVPVTTLDVWARTAGIGPIRFLKIDVEGHELDVLRGATDILKNDRPHVLVEAEQRHHDFPVTDVFRILLDHGYEGVFLDIVLLALRPLAEFDVNEHQRPQNHGSRHYVANFIFCPTETFGDTRGALERLLIDERQDVS